MKTKIIHTGTKSHWLCKETLYKKTYKKPSVWDKCVIKLFDVLYDGHLSALYSTKLMKCLIYL